MDNPLDINNRISAWKEVLNELIRLGRIEGYIISQSGLNIDIVTKTLFNFYLDFTEDQIHQICRDQVIDQLLDSE